MEQIPKAFKLTLEEEKEFSRAAWKAGVSIGELIRALLRGYVEAKQIRQ